MNENHRRCSLVIVIQIIRLVVRVGVVKETESVEQASVWELSVLESVEQCWLSKRQFGSRLFLSRLSERQFGSCWFESWLRSRQF